MFFTHASFCLPPNFQCSPLLLLTSLCNISICGPNVKQQTQTLRENSGHISISQCKFLLFKTRFFLVFWICVQVYSRDVFPQIFFFLRETSSSSSNLRFTCCCLWFSFWIYLEIHIYIIHSWWCHL